jgi:hypothetical protein
VLLLQLLLRLLMMLLLLLCLLPLLLLLCLLPLLLLQLGKRRSQGLPHLYQPPASGAF